MIQLTVIVVYLILLIGLGLIANRFFSGSSKDYMLASRSIGPFLLLMSLFGTTMTAFALVGSTGLSSVLGVGVYGMLASAAGIVHSACFFVIGVPLWAIGRRNGYTTQIQFFRARLDNQVIGFLLFPILVALVISYLLVGVVAAGVVINGLTLDAFSNLGWFESSNFGVPTWLASGAICVVVLSYVFLGGMRGTAWANAFQTAVFMILGVVAFFAIANGIGGTDSFWQNLKIASEAVPEVNLNHTKLPFTKFFSFLFIPLSVAMFPHVFQHWLTARSAAAFKLPIILHPVFVLIVWAPCVLVGIWASSSISGLEAGTGQNQVLALLVKTHAGPFLGGLIGAGILAAIMSSLDSQFLCLGTIFTEDIVANLSSRKLTDSQRVWLARSFVVLIVVIVYVLSQFPRAVFDLGLWSFTGFTGLFPLVFAAIYWRRLTAAGAMSCVLTTIGLWGYMFWQSGFGADKRYMLTPFGDAYPIMPVVVICIASGIAMVVTSLMTKPPSDETLEKFFR